MPAIAGSALDQVVLNLKQAAGSGLNQIAIQLKPAALGVIDVKLELNHDGHMTAVISADRSDTLMMLKNGSGELQQALRDAGIHTDAGSLSFNLRGDAQTNDQGARQGNAGGTAAASLPALDTIAVEGPAAYAAPAVQNGRVNIQV